MAMAGALAFLGTAQKSIETPERVQERLREDDELLRGIMCEYQRGNVHEFQRLYDKTLPVIRGYLYSVAHDRAQAVDLVQEAYLQLHRSRHTYNRAFPVKPWVIGIARHVWLMHRRSAARRTAKEVGLGVDVDIAVPAEMERLGDRSSLTKALSSVRRDHRECLILHHVYGLTFREIAGISGISEGAARTRASRGMAELRSALRPSTATSAD